jgi:hypothetical protein
MMNWELHWARYSRVQKVDFGVKAGPPLKVEWVQVQLFEKLSRMIARISNRIFVGLPLCTSVEMKVT